MRLFAGTVFNYKFTFHYVSIKSRSNTPHCRPCENLHSTMYLLNLVCLDRGVVSGVWFTFHYVSIKSCTQGIKSFLGCYLHSTMYLFNRNGREKCLWCCANLHSTMYLLNRRCPAWWYAHWVFTFHYVSIKSRNGREKCLWCCANLHSTMYLLNQ